MNFNVFFEKYRIIFGIGLIVLIFLYIQKIQEKENQKFNTEIDNNLAISIAKIKSKSRYHLNYVFYHKGRLFKDFSDEGDASLIGKYFIVEFSNKNPEFSRIRFDKEINDSVSIANSGFRTKTLNEILEAKYVH